MAHSDNSEACARVAVDWGTSSFRLWTLSADGQVLARANGPYGMASLSKQDFAQVLEDQLNRLSVDRHVPVLICGMAGAAQGWCEAPYLQAPMALSQLGLGAVRVPDIERQVHILPGFMQTQPCNVMRGEETQILGLLSARPDFNGVVCLPGTHSKWVRLSEGQIAHFTTCMTGEIFSLLCHQSVLKHSTAGKGWDAAAFVEAILQMMSAPASLADSLFGLRAQMLLEDLPPATARARLSGMLIGIELAATQAYWQDCEVALIGEASLCRHYATALASQSVAVDLLDSEAMTLSGITSAFTQLRET
ncbi:putative 2-dehydro-3-deoxygalactonokinase DgoK1 [Granulosicoccus antarcticus IMCC3135]|uniref:Putative 2-dehydro-3-deoxygalactonokinase DgoK1 n=1 Tax=Granulosicoccus antarcticus IMCC3135 TaxID=1192854 RepID=A0A2Z2P547_9GAMM|nr:putative 2-dehydro-3-deoxygalactonokinase DgoK1 [Granulosicoccus antarcticus IMCC3135]